MGVTPCRIVGRVERLERHLRSGPRTGPLERHRRLASEETAIVRQLAGSDFRNDTLKTALSEVTNERVTIEKEMSRLQATASLALTEESIDTHVSRLVDRAKVLLRNPDTALMAEIFDILELDILRVDGTTYEGVGRIPLLDEPGDEDRLPYLGEDLGRCVPDAINLNALGSRAMPPALSGVAARAARR